MSKPTTLDQFLTNVVEKPQVFFTSNQKIADSAIEMAKHFYDNVKQVEKVQFSPFTELLTEGFDNDQIWEEIASQNEPFLDYAKTTLKSFSKRPVKEYSEEEESESGESMDLDQGADQDEEMEEAEQTDEELEQAEEQTDEELEQVEELEQEQTDEEEEENDDLKEEVEVKETKKKPTSEVDDKFFNLDEFNKWTEKQEELDMMSDREDQDDEFDFDQDLDEEEDSEEEEEEGADAADLNYEDFFGNDEKTEYKRPTKPKKKEYEEELVSSAEEEDEDEEELESDGEGVQASVRDLFGAEEEDEEETDGKQKSTFQKQQERLAAQIEEYEEENVSDKHWTLRGEANAKIRPVNSLLEEDLEFEHANKPVPVITEESTNTLEEVIKKRILENMFDDVERKVDPNLRPFIPSKRVEISDEKAKQSLADMYEDDFVRKQTGSEKVDVRDEALEKDHAEITELFTTLCHKLDALSNFHYTPKAPKPEMSIVSNSAAISMEEVTPVNVSDATLLAPEEVYEKKRGDVKTAAEMEQDERKRLRAQKKKLKRKEREMKERELKIKQKYNPQIGQRQEKKKAVKELLNQKNVTVIGKDGQQKTTTKAVTSSSLF
ncbi:U3 small nucleolar ribonucleoprotein complex, subunit Mpp10 [Helicostylum pulchrum]|nr:U3 small nucleolar ribonucleoprotein complex, subunit Mpp10 [Helicostylum pulchrum]